MSSLSQRKSAVGSTFSYAGVDIDTTAFGHMGQSSQAVGAPLQSDFIGAVAEAGGVDTSLDPLAPLRKAGIPMRQIDLTGGIELQALMTREVTAEQIKYGSMLGWIRLLVAILYAVTALALLFVVIFRADDDFTLFWDPIRYSTIDKKWEVALEKVGTIHLAWALLALMSTFAVYHAVHFLPFVRDMYLRLVYFYQMNPIRWIFHGLIGGLFVAFSSLVMGVSSVIVLVLLMIVVMGGAVCVLFSEMINRPTIWNVEDSDTVASLQAEPHNLSQAAAYKAKSERYFIKPGAVTPWPILAAIVLLVTFMAVTSAYFWQSVADNSEKVPWYAWTTYFITLISFVIMAILNTARLVFSFAFLQNYFYVDVLHIPIELLFIWLNTILIIVGLSV